MSRLARRKPAPRRVTHRWDFDTWEGFLSQAEQPDQWGPHTVGTSMRPKPWNGNVTLEGAVELARYGWPEGRENMAEAIALANPTRTVFQATGRDVAGAYPIVPVAVAGDPMSMVTPRRQAIAAHPVVRIDYSLSVHGGISGQCIVNRGAALLSMVDALETRGYSVELRIFVKSYRGDYRGQLSSVYKRAGEPLDLDRAAFALTHPAVLRRLYMRLCEQHPELQADFDPGYGYADTSALDDDPATVYVPPANEGDSYPRGAMETMRALFSGFTDD